jgi:hypothetical protein
MNTPHSTDVESLSETDRQRITSPTCLSMTNENLGRDSFMSVDDYRQQDLFHIEKMIIELERLMQNGPIIAERNPVTRPEYWRNRIHALVNSSEATVSTTKHAAVLLERLANLSALSAQHDRQSQIGRVPS